MHTMYISLGKWSKLNISTKAFTVKVLIVKCLNNFQITDFQNLIISKIIIITNNEERFFTIDIHSQVNS